MLPVASPLLMLRHGTRRGFGALGLGAVLAPRAVAHPVGWQPRRSADPGLFFRQVRHSDHELFTEMRREEAAARRRRS